MNGAVESGTASTIERSALSAAALINAVGSLMEQLVELAPSRKDQIAQKMGVTPARISQLLAGDGNVRISTLARLVEACGADLALTATLRDGGSEISVPRAPWRTGRSLAPDETSGAESEDACSLKAAALINAVGSLLEQVVERSGRTRGAVASSMGVTAGRVTQILDGDGNIRISTLARVMEAAGADLRLVATERASGAQIAVPRAAKRRLVESRCRDEFTGAQVIDLASRRSNRPPDGENSARSSREVRERIHELAPVRQLVARGHLPKGSPEVQAQALCELFGIHSIWDQPVFVAAARRHNTKQPVTPLQVTWLACARKAARTLTVAKLDEAGLTDLAARLSRSLIEPVNFAQLPQKFAAVGVRLVWVQPFNGNRISGVAFPLEDDSEQPVIALSGRGQRLDKVLFTLLHEVAHVTLGHLSQGVGIIDEDDVEEDEREIAANERAASWMLTKPLVTPGVITRTWIGGEASRQGVHPIIIIGRLQRDGVLAWDSQFGRGAPKVWEQLQRWTLHPGQTT